MIEIAISLAIIGFALVAIIGILPIAMNAQKENRQETIINQDQTIWMDALRNGARGLDDLTNYVMAITNYRTKYVGITPTAQTLGYTFKDSNTSPKYPITNGFRIIGLLSAPKIIVPTNVPSSGKNQTYFSNHVVAFVRSMSGLASEKYPQTNSSVQDLALSYRLIVDVGPYSTNFFDPTWTNWGDPLIKGNTNQITTRSNYATLVRNYEANLHDIRLTFRWPLLPNGDGGPSRQIYRTMAGGAIQPVLEKGFPDSPEFWLYFFQPRTYVKVP